MKLRALTALLLLPALLFFSCAKGGEGKAGAKKLTIGFSLDTLKEERWQRDRDRFVQRATELGAEVLVQSANSDDTRQVQDVEALISRGVDALVIVPHNGEAMATCSTPARTSTGQRTSGS